MNRADEHTVRYMQYYIDQYNPDKDKMYKLAKEFGQ
jgi:fatty acid synthase subunit alpha